MAIRILLPEVASQIAAGEVVERPASVVKELLENALDAGASQVTIQVLGAGRRLIEVADDGCGIVYGELKLATERHATSKLKTADDLFQITTLGFRGEALASIASVSHLTIVSRTVEEQVAGRLRIDGGVAGELERVGAPTGTLVRVEDLFYNVPARLKFLKHETTERRQIDNLVTRYALAYAQTRISLHQEGRPALQTSGNGDQREILAALYGADVARQMLSVIAEDGEIDIHGFISPVALTRSNRREIFFFVNGRPVQDASLTTALLKAYHTLLMVGRFPQAILFVDMPPNMLDVNVHPTKAEVRFRDPERVFSSVQRAVRRAILAHAPVPGLGAGMQWTPHFPTQPDQSTWTQASTNEWTDAETETIAIPGSNQENDPRLLSPEQATLTQRHAPILRLVGQIANTYLVAEGPDGLYLIDQHAAHERVLFEKFTLSQDAEIPSQSLLQPATVSLSAGDSRLLSQQLSILEKIGFHVEPFGLNTFLVRAIPAVIKDSDPGTALRALVEDFEEDETPLQAEVEARMIARICKRAAIKAGKSLSPEEQLALLDDLEGCQSPRTCPHGRPTMIHLSVDLLERQFGRRGAG
jgi:DNA mismatch repair protein MutL